jgi:hypothetical protein
MKNYSVYYLFINRLIKKLKMEEKKELINYISTENNAKVDFCSSEKENGKCVNILSEEKVRIIYFNKKKSNLNS